MICFVSFFYNDTATTESYTLSLHDALPIFRRARRAPSPAGSATGRPTSGTLEVPALMPSDGTPHPGAARHQGCEVRHSSSDRKSTRLNSSHANISYAVFCLTKKNLTSTRAY